jgi:hypothetical protein
MMACSLSLTGVCGLESANIKIATDPVIGLAQVLLSDQCMFTNCGQDCASICSLNVLKVAFESEWEALIQDEDWDPVPGLRVER